jgi:hypothetical protein
MKKSGFILIVVLAVFSFSSCQNKTIELLAKKWDCVKVENLNTGGTGFQSRQDSINSIQLQAVLESLSWTFKTTMEYECSVAGKVTISGTYELSDDDKVLVCTPSTKNTINRYMVNTLTENDLVLSSSTGNTPLILHFKPN